MVTSQRSMSTAPPTPAAEVGAAISAHIASKGVQPRADWLQTFLSTARLATPLPALQKTAVFRLLATDFTSTIQTNSSSTFPATVSDPGITEMRLPGPIPVQVLDIEDIGRSRWSQVEAIEAQERGETTKGREVIRVVPEDSNGPPGNTQAASNDVKSSGPHKLLLQDGKGTKVYGFELTAVNGIVVGMPIGAKLVLRNVAVARGVVMLEPHAVEVLGGKVEAWEKKWRDDRKDKLKEKAGMRDIV